MRLESSLVWAGPILQSALLVILVRRRLYRWRQLPFFFLYTLYSVVVETSRHLVVGHAKVYFRLYWSTEALYNVLALLVMWEVFRRAFAQEYEQHHWFRLVLPGIAVLVTVLCFWEALRHPLDSRFSLPESVIYWSDLGVHGLEGAVCALYLVLRRPLAAPRSRYEFGILVGFGVNACVSMVAFLALFEFRTHSVRFFRYGPPVAWVLGTVIWLVAFWRAPAPQRKLDLETLRRLTDFVSREAEDAERDFGERLAGSAQPL